MPLIQTPHYLTGVRSPLTDELANYHGDDLPLGLLVQPQTRQYLDYQHLYRCCGLDNGRFSEAGRKKFKLPVYFDMVREAIDKFGDYLLFVTAPDVPMDWPGTLAMSRPVLPQIRKLGATAALVVQDGATPDTVPWDECDAIFIGGSTEWKVGPQAAAIARAARTRRPGSWVHMGRVNSMVRMKRAQDMHCDSADGTYLMYCNNAEGVEHILSWLRETQRRNIRRAVAELGLLPSKVRGDKNAPKLGPESYTDRESGWATLIALDVPVNFVEDGSPDTFEAVTAAMTAAGVQWRVGDEEKAWVGKSLEAFVAAHPESGHSYYLQTRDHNMAWDGTELTDTSQIGPNKRKLTAVVWVMPSYARPVRRIRR